jgi:hypothetical protein
MNEVSVMTAHRGVPTGSGFGSFGATDRTARSASRA